MNITEALKKVNELQYLIGQKVPELNIIIDDIIPAPNDKTFDNFLSDYLYTHNIEETIKIHSTANFEILLLCNSKKKTALDVLTNITNFWYSDFY